MAGALFDDRRHGAGADDFLRQRLGLHGSLSAAGRLLFCGVDLDDDAGLWLGQLRHPRRARCKGTGQPAGPPGRAFHRRETATEAGVMTPWRPAPARTGGWRPPPALPASRNRNMPTISRPPAGLAITGAPLPVVKSSSARPL